MRVPLRLEELQNSLRREGFGELGHGRDCNFLEFSGSLLRHAFTRVPAQCYEPCRFSGEGGERVREVEGSVASEHLLGVRTSHLSF